MKALVLQAPGKPDTLTITELPLPIPGAGEIRVKVRAASLNPIDYKVSLNGHPDWVYPFVLGVDIAGVVDSVGEGVTQWSVGDRVVYHNSFVKPGGYAEYNVTKAHVAAVIPDGLSFAEAAAFPCAGLTAYQALKYKMGVRSGQSILVHAGAGGVGGYAIQLARAFGASKVLTTASPANFDYVKSLGADMAIDYNTENVQEKVLEATNGLGVDYILNSVNRVTAQADLSMLSFGGQLACIAGAPEIVADFQPSTKTFSVHKIMIAGAYVSGNILAEKELSTMASEFMQLIVDKKVASMVTEVISLEEVPQALIRLSQRHVRGKIVVEI